MPSRVVSSEQVALVPEYHWYVYGAVPPDAPAASVRDCPESIVGFAGAIVPAMRFGFTVTMLSGEQRETGVEAESVILYEYTVAEDGEPMNVEDTAPEMGLVHEPAANHWYE